MKKTELLKKLRETTGAGMLDCQKALQATQMDLTAAIKWLREKGKVLAAKKVHRVTKEGLLKATFSGNRFILIELNAETDFVVKNQQFQTLADDLLAIIDNSAVNANFTLDSIMQLTNTQGETITNLIANSIGVIGENIKLSHVIIKNITAEESLAYYIHANNKVGAYIIYQGKLPAATARQICMHIVALNPTFIRLSDINPAQKEAEAAIILKMMQNDPSMTGKPEMVLKKIAHGKLQKQLQNQCLLSQNFVVDPTQTVAALLEDHKTDIKVMYRHQLGEE